MYFDNVSALFQRLNRLGEARRPCFFLINYELTEGYLSLAGEEAPDFWATIQGRSNVTLPAPEDFPAPVAPNLTIHPESLETYARRFEIIQVGLHHGNSFLANLTIRTPIEGPLSLQSIFLHSPALYKVCLPHQFVCFSPERFIAIDAQGRIAAHPMKGTIDATLPNAAETIMADPKEQAEHATIVDLLVSTGLERGRNAARKTIAGGGAYLNNVKVEDEATVVGPEHLLAGGVVLVRKGRRNLAVGRTI